jgi:hypothetical protein
VVPFAISTPTKAVWSDLDPRALLIPDNSDADKSVEFEWLWGDEAQPDVQKHSKNVMLSTKTSDTSLVMRCLILITP